MKPGDVVFVKKFNRDGVIIDLLPKNKVKVTLGSLAVTVDLNDVSESQTVAAPAERKKHNRSFSIQSSTEQSCPWTKDFETIDFHGATVDEALVALERRISNALISRQGRIKVVHGFGSGKVMDAVHRYLSNCTMITSFRVDEFNPGQTWVYL
jgi:DNA mismatch repair protein MutS2